MCAGDPEGDENGHATGFCVARTNVLAELTTFLRAMSHASDLLAMLIVMMALKLPHGILNENERHYFEVVCACIAPHITPHRSRVAHASLRTGCRGWYRRCERQREIFRGDCPRPVEHRVGYAIVDATAYGTAVCG